MLPPPLKACAIAAGAFAVLATTMSSPAHAVLTLSFKDGGASATVTDDDGDGILRFNQSLSAFDINSSLALSKPRLDGTPGIFDLSSSNSTLVPGTLIIEASDSGFTTPTDYLNFGIGGTTDGAFTYEAFVSPTNGDPFLGTLVASGSASTLVRTGVFSDAQRLALPLGGTDPYAIGLRFKIDHGTGSLTSSFDSQIRVSEPGSLGLLGAGLVLAGLMLKRRRSRQA